MEQLTIDVIYRLENLISILASCKFIKTEAVNFFDNGFCFQ